MKRPVGDLGETDETTRSNNNNATNDKGDKTSSLQLRSYQLKGIIGFIDSDTKNVLQGDL